MNNIRIRYVLTDSNDLISKRFFRTNLDCEVRVCLSPATKSFKIVDSVSGAVLIDGETTAGLHHLKKAAKKALIFLGVNFDAEHRQTDIQDA